MILINYTPLLFEAYIESIATEELTDLQYELEYQGLCIADKCRYLMSVGVNVKPNAALNGITI